MAVVFLRRVVGKGGVADMPIDYSIPARFGELRIASPDLSTLAALKQQAAQREALKAQQEKDAAIGQLTQNVIGADGSLNMASLKQIASIDQDAATKVVNFHKAAFPQMYQNARGAQPIATSEGFYDAAKDGFITSPTTGKVLMPPSADPERISAQERRQDEREKRQEQRLLDREDRQAKKEQSRQVASTAAKAQEGLNSMQSAYDVLDKYEGILNQNGPKLLDPELDAAYTALTLELKNVAQLGALAGPDLALLEGMVTPPTSVKGQTFGKEGLRKQLKLIRDRMDKARGRLLKMQPAPGEITTPGAEVNGKKVGGAKSISNDAIKKILKGGL